MEVSDSSLSLNPNPDGVLTQQTPEASKKRKVLQKTVVTVRIGSKKAGKLKNEGPPPDFWSWRKYGQKPIKGSPFPRGYYRCSTSKGCSAKKQVERSKTDGSMFIITYTSSHNHPGPSISTLSLDPQEQETQPQPSDQDLTYQEQEKQDRDDDDDEKPSIIPSDGEATEEQSSSPTLNSSSKEIAAEEEEEDEEEEEEEEEEGEGEGEGPGPLTMEVEKPVKDEPNISCSHQLMNKSEENDFFDELEELPTPPSFSSFMRSYFLDEIRIPAAPS